ncbi:MAG: hypothetical protein ACO24H_10780 [Polynucleobacter sp.]
MNETNCERCGEVPADTLVEHTLWAEAVCFDCVHDEFENSGDEMHEETEWQ